MSLIQNNTIEYFVRNVYGNETMYIANDDIAACIQAINSKKTIFEADMKNLTTLFGIEWVQVIDPVTKR